MIKACIFDLDGTILDTITTITYYVNKTLQKFGIAEISEDECKIFVGDGAYMLIKRTLESRGIFDRERINEVLSDYNNRYNSAPIYLTKAFDKMAEALSLFKERGIKLAVLSNKPDFLVKEITAHFYPGIFDFVMGGRPDIPLKPDKTAPLAVCKELAVNPSDTCMIGDTSVDILTGKAFSACLSIGVTWGFRSVEELNGAGADVTVNTVDELICEVLKNV